MNDLTEKKKYPFKRGDWCQVGSPERNEEIFKALCTNGYGGYILSDESFMFGVSIEQERLNEMPYNDMLCLVRGKLPEEWCVECTGEVFDTKEWGDLIKSVRGHEMTRAFHFYGIENGSATGSDFGFGTKILLSTWAAIWELNEECQHQEHDIMTGVCGKCNADIPTLEEQVNEYKGTYGMDFGLLQPAAFICIEDGRILLKIDAQGFISIDGQVVGHEPGLPKFFTEPEYMTTSNGTKYQVRNHSVKPYVPADTIKQMELITEKLHDSMNSLPDFNPELPFEATNDHGQNVWYPQQHETKYIGIDKQGRHVVENEVYTFCTYNYIRNIKEPEFTENQPVWYTRPNDDAWYFGYVYKENKATSTDGFVHEAEEIRPFFVNGVATYPPFS